MKTNLHRVRLVASLLLFSTAPLCFGATAPKAPKAPAKPDDLVAQVGDGYRGIWYMNQPVKSEYVYKYSGGFATYPQQHVPIAIYVESQKKTFFVFGGSAGNVSETKDELQHYVSYYDHATGTVPRPVRLVQKRTEDAHDNPTLSIDADGYLYVFLVGPRNVAALVYPQIEKALRHRRVGAAGDVELFLHAAVVSPPVEAVPVSPYAL